MKQTLAKSRPISQRLWFGLGFLLLALLWTGVMITSIWFWFGYSRGGWFFEIGDGTLYVKSPERGATPLEIHEQFRGWAAGENESSTPRQRGIAYEIRKWTWTWWAWGKPHATVGQAKMYSVWPASLLMVGVGVWLSGPVIVSSLRRRKGNCVSCGYSLEGLAAGAVCPECGTSA